MSLVIITGDGPEHCFVTNRICAAHKVEAILVCDPPVRRNPGRLLRSAPLAFVDKLARMVFLKLTRDADRRRSDLRQVLGASTDGFAQPGLVERVGPPNAPNLLDRMTVLAPRIIAVYGTGIIPDPVLARASEVALNMHTGLSPDYRGVACTTWPLIDGRPDMIGATVHECVADVDGGRVFARANATIAPGDSIHAVFARAVAAGASIYVTTIGAALNSTLKGEPQDLNRGHEYRGQEIGIRSELAARKALRRLR